MPPVSNPASRIAHPASRAPRAPRATATGVSFAAQSPVRVSVTKPERRENNRLTGEDRRTVVLKAEGLGLNSPYFEGALMNAADYRGPLTPYLNSPDTEWKDAVNPWFKSTFLDRADWDASGNCTLAEFQRLMWYYHDLTGDCFGVQTWLEPGNKLSRPVARLIPSLMCDSPGYGYGPSAANDWIDGVRVGFAHRPVAYHFLYEETATRFAAISNRAGYVVDASMLTHFARRTSIGGTRGVTRFLTTGNTAIDMTMMDSAMHRIFDLAAKIGGVITQEKDTSPDLLKPAVAPNFNLETTPSAAEENADAVAEGEEAESLDITLLSEQLQQPGATLVDFSDTPGKKMETRQLSGLLPEVAEVTGHAIQKFCMPWGLPPQVLLCMFSGIFNVTGPGFRISLARGSRWRTEELRKMRPFVLTAARRHLAWGLQTKQIPYPKKSVLDPLSLDVRTEPDLTIDEQRDVNNDLKRLQMGVTSEKELAHLYGRQLEDVARERTEFINLICDTLGDRKQFWGDNFKEKTPAPAAPASGS